MEPIQAVTWSDERDGVRILDQRLLPEREVYRDLRSVEDVCDAIKTLAVRGAPAIGIARSEERRVGKECRSRWSPYH